VDDAGRAWSRDLAADLAAIEDWGTAVVTNAPRANAEQMLAGLGLSARFDVVVIGDELARGKPDPLPYATALALLGAEPGRAVAFEDSRSGIAAARAAGVCPVGMAPTLDGPALREAGADAAIADFADPVLMEALRVRFGSSPAPG
ncbi:MAG: HAD family hydrolase, partial [Alphaproteobacteria bacterium]